MLEHIGILAYLLTRLDHMTTLLHNITFFTIVAFIVMVVFCLFSDKEWDEDIQFLKKNGKRLLWILIPSVLLSMVVPNRQEGLIILGAQVGADVVLESKVTLGEMAESERFAKIMELVDAKIDKLVAESKKDAEDTSKGSK